jgi:nucleotide-binding universal stress UspA family protein
MAHTIDRDVVTWIKHAQGGDTAARLEAIAADSEVTLVVDGARGRW